MGSVSYKELTNKKGIPRTNTYLRGTGRGRKTPLKSEEKRGKWKKFAKKPLGRGLFLHWAKKKFTPLNEGWQRKKKTKKRKKNQSTVGGG